MTVSICMHPGMTCTAPQYDKTYSQQTAKQLALLRLALTPVRTDREGLWLLKAATDYKWTKHSDLSAKCAGGVYNDVAALSRHAC